MKTNSVSSRTTSVEDRALALLASGLPTARVAEAIGVDPSRISQLVSDEVFREKLIEAKFVNLNKHNEHDAKLDSVETKLVDKIHENIDSIYKPLDLIRALQVINSAKRRGSSAPAAITEQNTILNLVMPTKIINNFTTTINNVVVKAGETELVTIQASSLKDMAQNDRSRIKEISSNQGE